MKSLWMDETEIQDFPMLMQDITVDVAVVGGGMAGILTAYLLKEQGVHVAVLEADRIGGGQTGKTTAKITSQHGVIYQKLLSKHGQEAAEKYSLENQKAIDRYEKIVQDRQIACGFVRCPAYLYTLEAPELLKEEAECAAGLSIEASFTKETELPFQVAGAVRFENQARFHPLLFLEAAARDLAVYEHSRVLQAEGDRLVTENGSVRAKKIVFACHYPFLNMPGYYFMRMHQERSYVVGLEQVPELEGMYLGVDREQAWSFRSAGSICSSAAEATAPEKIVPGQIRTSEKKSSRILSGQQSAVPVVCPGLHAHGPDSLYRQVFCGDSGLVCCHGIRKVGNELFHGSGRYDNGEYTGGGR